MKISLLEKKLNTLINIQPENKNNIWAKEILLIPFKENNFICSQCNKNRKINFIWAYNYLDAYCYNYEKDIFYTTRYLYKQDEYERADLMYPDNIQKNKCFAEPIPNEGLGKRHVIIYSKENCLIEKNI